MSDAGKQVRRDLEELVEGTKVPLDVVKMIAGAVVSVVGGKVSLEIESKEGRTMGALTRNDGLALLHEGLGEYMTRTVREARETALEHRKRKASAETEPPPPDAVPGVTT